MKIIFGGIAILITTVSCNTSPSFSRNTGNTHSSPKLTALASGAITEQFTPGSQLITHDLIQLNIVDTIVYSSLGEVSLCDTTVQLNDSISYSIISVNDAVGICRYFFIATFNKGKDKIIEATFIHPDCNIDYSLDTYELYGHALIDKDKIEITNTITFQKKNKISSDEEQNIDHQQIQQHVITISPNGQIGV